MIQGLVDAVFWTWVWVNAPWILVAAGFFGLAYVINRLT